MNETPATPPSPAPASPPPAPNAAPPPPPPPRRRRRLWLRLLGWTGASLLLLVLVVFLAGPFVAAAVAKRQIVSNLEKSVDGQAVVDDVSASWFRPAVLEGLRVTNPAGEEILTVRRAIVRVPLARAVRGDIDVDVQVEEPFLAVDRWKKAARPREPKAPREPRRDEFPRMHVDVRVTGARVSFGDSMLAVSDSSLSVDLAGTGGRAEATLTGAALTGGGTTTTEPRLTATAEFDWKTPDLVLRSAQTSTSFAHLALDGVIRFGEGRVEFRPLQGRGAYVPEKLGAALRPVLPGSLTGSEERPISFRLEGAAGRYDLLSVLRGADGQASLSIAPYAGRNFSLAGDLAVTLEDGKATTRSALDFNGGKLTFDALADLRAEPDAASTFKVELRQVSANAAMSELLSRLHPIFALAEGRVDGLIQGRIDLDLEAGYRAPLPEDLKGGWAAIPRKPFHASGRFAIRDLTLAGTPLLGELLTLLGRQDTREVQLDAIEFAIDGARLTYSKPVPMRIGGVSTQWTGTIGLDRTLDLQWEIPVTDRIADRFPFLKSLGSLKVPVGGTATRPLVRFDQLVAQLGANGAREALEEKGGELVDEILKGRDARRTLEKADKLWDEGKIDDAAAQYRRLHDQYARTRAYRDNEKRILERMK